MKLRRRHGLVAAAVVATLLAVLWLQRGRALGVARLVYHAARGDRVAAPAGPTVRAEPVRASPLPCTWSCDCVAGTPLTPQPALPAQPAGVRVYAPGIGHFLHGTRREWAWVERDTPAGPVCVGALTRLAAGRGRWRAQRLLPDGPRTRAWMPRSYLDETSGAAFGASGDDRAAVARWLWSTTPVPPPASTPATP